MTFSNKQRKLSLLRLQGYSDMGRYALQPLSYETLDYASGFASEQCPEGFCAVSRNTLRILTLERLGEAFNQQVPHCCLCSKEQLINSVHGGPPCNIYKASQLLAQVACSL